MKMAWMVMLAACAAASADEPPPTAADLAKKYRLTVPADWVELPKIAEAARAAATTAAKDVTSTVVAWGQPAAGCYAVLAEHRGGAKGESLEASAKRLRETLAALGVPPAVAPAKGTRPADVLDLDVPIASKQHDVTGTVRARLYRAAGVPQATALACFHNQREPDHCRTLCQALILQLAPP
jgi:hypothetical protein